MQNTARERVLRRKKNWCLFFCLLLRLIIEIRLRVNYSTVPDQHLLSTNRSFPSSFTIQFIAHCQRAFVGLLWLVLIRNKKTKGWSHKIEEKRRGKLTIGWGPPLLDRRVSGGEESLIHYKFSLFVFNRARWRWIRNSKRKPWPSIIYVDQMCMKTNQVLDFSEEQVIDADECISMQETTTKHLTSISRTRFSPIVICQHCSKDSIWSRHVVQPRRCRLDKCHSDSFFFNHCTIEEGRILDGLSQRITGQGRTCSRRIVN